MNKVEGLKPEKFFNYKNGGFWACLFAIFVVGTIARFCSPVGYCEWIDRDIQRTIGLISGQHVPLVGPEMNTGGFLPGPFLYVLMAPALLFSHSPYSVVYYNQFLNVVSIVLLCLIIKKLFSPFTVLVTVALVSFSVIHIFSFSNPINPSFLLFLNTVMLWFYIKLFINNKEWYLVPAVVLTALGSQIHFSFSAHAISIVTLLLFVQRVRWRVVVVSVGGALLVFVPYILYQYSTRVMALYRTYDEFTPSASAFQFLPKDVFLKIFSSLPSDAVWQNVRQAVGFLHQGLAARIERSHVVGYLRLSSGIELSMFIMAGGLGLWWFSVWGYKSKWHFNDDQKKRIVPFLAVFPLLILWQWSGFARHPHHWYGLVFFPIVPLWIGSSLDMAAEKLSLPIGSFFKKTVLVFLFLLSLKSLVYSREGFFRLGEVVANIRDVKHQLGLSLDRYRNDVFFLDRPLTGKFGQIDPPFEFPPWGTYTDYLYETMASDISVPEAPQGKCYLIGHKSMVDHYSRDYYLEQIQKNYLINPGRIFESPRFVYFEYAPRPDGNCYHNTINAWVHNERMNYLMGQIPKDGQSVLLEKREKAMPTQKTYEFVVFDRTSSLPLKVIFTIEKAEKGSVLKASLDSGQLMGHLNNTIAYSGLFRPWPHLWIEDVNLAYENNRNKTIIQIAEGEVGRSLLTPLASKPYPLDVEVDDENYKLTLSYKVNVLGTYVGTGEDIQSLAKDTGTKKQWESSITLFDGTHRL